MKSGKKMKHITANRKYVISTTNAFGTGWETMVFNFDKSKNTIVDWQELDGERYVSSDDAEAGHRKYIEKWEKE